MKKTIVLTALGCLLTAVWAVAPEASGAATFSKDVAPIFRARCEECHRAGGVAPMALSTYEQARPWARSIREKVISREMPPFHAAGALGRYKNDPRLTEDEISAIVKWVDAGAPKGNAKDMPPPRRFEDRAWARGEPDLVLKVKQPYAVRASERDQYSFFVFDYVFPEDIWIRSVDTRPGNLKVVHHANTHVVPPEFKVPEEGFIAGDFDPGARGTVMMAGWAPGVEAVFLPEGVGVRIPKGMRLGIQVHYAPTDKDAIDETRVGLYFADGTIRKNLRVLFGDRRDVEIPPGDPNYSLTAKKTFDTDAIIHFYHVHMHLRGKSYVMKLTYPDGREETGIEVPRYDFNWQRTYVLSTPLRVPKGTQVDFTGTYDNSAKNRFNPDPAATVRWGEKTTDEMMQGRIFYEAVGEDLNLRVKKGRVATPADSASSEERDER
jgi:cytochrome c553